MKKIMKIMAVLVLMFVAFTTGAVWAHNHNRATLTITTSVKNNTEVERLQRDNDNLRHELNARTTLDDSIVDKAYEILTKDGKLNYRLYVDGKLCVSVHTSVSEYRTEWDCISNMADNVTELEQHYGEGTEVEVRFI